MELLPYLQQNAAAIVDEAAGKVGRAAVPHYAAAGPERTRAQLRALLDRVVSSLAERSLLPVVEHAQAIARERFAAGFDLAEVQVAFNVLEEVIWGRVLQAFPPAGFAEALGLVGTVLGGGKDALARTYVALASRGHAPSLDLRALFEGQTGV